MRRFKYFMLLVMCAISMTAMAQKDKPKPLEMELWLSQAPYQTAKNEQDTAKLYVFLPEAKKSQAVLSYAVQVAAIRIWHCFTKDSTGLPISSTRVLP